MYPGQKISVTYIKDDAAGAKTAAQLVSILASGGWLDADGSSLTQATGHPAEKAFPGLQIYVNDHDLKERQLPNAAIPLTLSLEAMGLARQSSPNTAVPRGAIQLAVGTAQ